MPVQKNTSESSEKDTYCALERDLHADRLHVLALQATGGQKHYKDCAHVYA